MNYPEPTARLIESCMKLPGIDQKVATRLAFHTINIKEEDANTFAEALISVKRDLHFCSARGNTTEESPCETCQDKNYDRNIILVVEEPKDAIAMEKMHEYQSLYHVLHGALSSMEGTELEGINIASLIKRLHDGRVKGIIIVANVTTGGGATAMYLSRLVKPAGIIVTRLTRSLSVGSDIEYADEIILLEAVEGCREI